MKYPNSDQFVIQDLSLNIKKGERLGIRGKSGSGKSTLGDIFLGLILPNKGKVFIDDVLLDNFNSASWYNCVASVSQNYFLRNLTIAENIAYGETIDQIDFNRLKWAAKLAQVDEIVQNLPQKYLYNISERGDNFSGGEKQRIAIARAFYKSAEIIVFDEATSALDIETEASIVNSISLIPKSITVIVIAHRLSTLEVCDRVIEISKGRIVDLIEVKQDV